MDWCFASRLPSSTGWIYFSKSRFKYFPFIKFCNTYTQGVPPNCRSHESKQLFVFKKKPSLKIYAKFVLLKQKKWKKIYFSSRRKLFRKGTNTNAVWTRIAPMTDPIKKILQQIHLKIDFTNTSIPSSTRIRQVLQNY